MKDNFSHQADEYARFRPTYPTEWYDFLYDHLSRYEHAWDCATGNGQIAEVLAKRFSEVWATDISLAQLQQAPAHPNITYRQQAAETADFSPEYFDLITVGQAIHWLDHERFYRVVDHCLRSSGLLALIGYQLFRIDPAVNTVIDTFYHEVIGPYWDAERRHIDRAYTDIPFPYPLLPTPAFSLSYQWNFQQVIGYLGTWSAVQHFRREKGQDPVALIREELQQAWGREETKRASFPLLVRVGQKT